MYRTTQTVNGISNSDYTWLPGGMIGPSEKLIRTDAEEST
jgi:hypothetical protein